MYCNPSPVPCASFRLCAPALSHKRSGVWWQSGRKFENSQNSSKICILTHYWTSKKYSTCVDVILDSQEMILIKVPKEYKKSAADFFGCCFVFYTVISWKSKIKSIRIQYIQWNIFLSRSNYISKDLFSVNFVNFWISCQIAIRRPDRFQILHVSVTQSANFERRMLSYMFTWVCQGRMWGFGPQ